MRYIVPFFICLFLLVRESGGQQPRYTQKHFLKTKDTSEFKSITPRNGFVCAFVPTEVIVWDLDDDGNTYVRGSEIALVCFEGQHKNNQNEGLFSGYLIDSADHSKRYKIYEQSYQNGKLNGQWKTYSLKGTLVNFQTFKNDSLNGISRNFWVDGKTIMDEQEYFNGRSRYINREFFENGNIKSEIPFENDVLNGTGKKYYESGRIETEANFKNGKFHGSHKYYYPNGQLWNEIIYREGKYWEVVSNYSDNGKKREAGSLRNGNGTIIYYNDDGSIRETLKIIDGEEVK